MLYLFFVKAGSKNNKPRPTLIIGIARRIIERQTSNTSDHLFLSEVGTPLTTTLVVPRSGRAVARPASALSWIPGSRLRLAPERRAQELRNRTSTVRKVGVRPPRVSDGDVRVLGKARSRCSSTQASSGVAVRRLWQSCVSGLRNRICARPRRRDGLDIQSIIGYVTCTLTRLQRAGCKGHRSAQRPAFVRQRIAARETIAGKRPARRRRA